MDKLNLTKQLTTLFSVLFLGLFLIIPSTALAKKIKEKPVQVVYHIDNADKQALAALRNIRNHLVADPTVQIQVVALADGIEFLLEDAKDKNGNPYEALVGALVSEGVVFKLCAFTLERKNIDEGKVILDADLIPSGVAEIAKLQYREAFAYIKP